MVRLSWTDGVQHVSSEQVAGGQTISVYRDNEEVYTVVTFPYRPGADPRRRLRGACSSLDRSGVLATPAPQYEGMFFDEDVTESIVFPAVKPLFEGGNPEITPQRFARFLRDISWIISRLEGEGFYMIRPICPDDIVVGPFGALHILAALVFDTSPPTGTE